MLRWGCSFDHFMQKEIHEQPDSLLQTMRGRVAFNRSSLDLLVRCLRGITG